MDLSKEEWLEALYRAAPIPNNVTPLAYFAAGFATILGALQVRKAFRQAFVPVFGLLLFQGLIHAPTVFHEFAWCYDWGLFMVILFLYSMFKLFIDPQVQSAPKGSMLSPKNWIWAYKVLAERTSTVAKPNSSRFSFLLSRLFSTAVVGTVLSLTPFILFPGPFMPLGEDDFDPEHQVYFRRLFFGTGPPVTLRETAMRSIFVVFAGGGQALELIQCHNLLSIFFVCVVFIDRPEDWPSFFSSPTAIQSLSSFWGRFWHRVVVRTYAGIGGFLSEHVLGLKPRSSADRFVVHGLVFSISGAVHAVVSWAFGQHCEQWRDWAWFAGTFPAILLEERIVAAAVWLTGAVLGNGESAQRSIKTVRVVTGLTYLFWWFFWSVPKLYYPKSYCLPGAFE